jgi:tetratricopeptide (TPR) repeat protein
MGRTDEAVRHAELARKMGDPAADEILARALLAKGDLNGAEAAARASLGRAGDRGKGALTLARVAVKRNDLPGGLRLVATAEQASGRGLPPAGLHLLKGDILARLNRHSEAEAEFRAEVRAFPATYQAWESLVLLLAAQGRPADARAAVSEMIATVPGVDSYLSAIRALAVVGDAASAAHWQREGLARYPEEPRLRRMPRAA